MNRLTLILLNTLCLFFPLGILITIWAINNGYKNQAYIFGFWTVIGFFALMGL